MLLAFQLKKLAEKQEQTRPKYTPLQLIYDNSLDIQISHISTQSTINVTSAQLKSIDRFTPKPLNFN
jgi:hypothetical protein